MIRTITIGSISIQGVVERLAANGLMTVRVGQQTFTGKPVPRPA
ncbi:hypothetical protein [Paracoccus jiaweipingae]